ncbi:MAG: TonB-dependent receptor plug domain-containing protein, partial [Bacteroidota bacterium]
MQPTSLIYFIILVLCGIGIPLSGQDVKEVSLTANYQDTPLNEVLQELENKYGLSFSYLQNTLDGKTVTNNFKNADWQKIADFLTDRLGIAVKMLDGGYVTLTPLPPSAPRKRSLCFRIKEKNTQEPLPFVTISVPERGESFYSNEQGWCRQQVQAADTDSLTISFLGYAPQTIAITALGNNCPTLSLAPAEFELMLVEVLEYLTDGIDATPEGHQVVLKPQEVPSLPGFTENEVYRSLQLLPGVNSPDETAAGINIRGGFRDQTQIIWDGITVYGTGHLGGMVSFFSPELIEETNIWRGPADAAYGGRLSGVINMETDRRISDRIAAGGNLNLTHGNAYVKLPLLKGKSDLHLSGRGTLSALNQTPTFRSLGAQSARNPLLETIFEDEMDGEDNQQLLADNQEVLFEEFNGRWQWNPTDAHRFTISSFLQRNSTLIELTDADSFGNYLDDRTTTNSGLSATYAGTLSSRSQLEVQVAHSLHETAGKNTFGEEFVFFGSARQVALTETSLKLGWQRHLAPNHQFHIGIQLQQWKNQFNYEELLPFDLDEDIIEQSFSALGVAAHGTYTFSSGSWRANLGARFQYYAPTARWYPEPRLTGSYQLNDTWRIKAGFGVNHQFLSEVLEIDLENLGANIPFWVLADGENINLPNSHEFNFGFIGQKRGWLFDVEVYHKRVRNLSSVEFLERDDDQAVFSPADSRSSGIDFLLKRRWGPVRSWIIYTLSNVEARFPRIGSRFSPADNDQR